ncbi:MAG: M56 family metallopeptidase [Hungatella sp.]
MNEILLLNIKFFIVMNLCYLIIQIVIKYLLKNGFHGTRYSIMKLVPVISVAIIGIDYFFERIVASYYGIKTIANGELTSNVAMVPDTHGLHLLLDSFVKCFFIIWIIGVFVLLVKYGLEYFCFRRIYCSMEGIASTHLNEKLAACNRKIGLTHPINIFFSKNAEVPFTCGIVKPNIIIPNHMSENLEPIILHELMHCISYDMLAKTIVEFLKIVQWFNPLIYLYALDLAEFCELACDEKVSRLLTFEERKEYAYEILNSARVHKFSTYSTTFSSIKNYQKRLYYLLYPIEGKKKSSKFFLVLCIILIMISGYFLMKSFNSTPFSEALSNIHFREETLKKTIKVNYAYGEEKEEFYYEEYIDGFWWSGTLTAEESKEISNNLIEITFAGEIYKCNE